MTPVPLAMSILMAIFRSTVRIVHHSLLPANNAQVQALHATLVLEIML